MARHNEGYAAYLLGDIPRSLAGMALAEELESDVFTGPARLDRAQVLLEAGLVKEAVEALHAGLESLQGDGHDQMRAEFELALARAHRLLGHLDLAAEAAASARETYGRIGATAWAAKAMLVGLLVDLDRQRRTRRVRDESDSDLVRRVVGVGDTTVALAAAATADELTETATELGDPELADSARVVAAQALLLAGDAAGANTRLLSLDRVPVRRAGRGGGHGDDPRRHRRPGPGPTHPRPGLAPARGRPAGQREPRPAHGSSGPRGTPLRARPRARGATRERVRARGARAMAQCDRPPAVARPTRRRAAGVAH